MQGIFIKSNSEGVTMKLKITERGWAGHFICASSCLFRRNTLIEFGKKKIVVSTVGGMQLKENDTIKEIGLNRFYETMAFRAKKEGQYLDADVLKPIFFESKWALGKEKNDNIVNMMHENVVNEIVKKMKVGIL